MDQTYNPQGDSWQAFIFLWGGKKKINLESSLFFFPGQHFVVVELWHMEFPSYLHLARGHQVQVFCTRQLSKPSVLCMGIWVHKAIKAQLKLPVASFIFSVLCKHTCQCFPCLNQLHCAHNCRNNWKSYMLKSIYNTAQSYSPSTSRKAGQNCSLPHW